MEKCILDGDFRRSIMEKMTLAEPCRVSRSTSKRCFSRESWWWRERGIIPKPESSIATGIRWMCSVWGGRRELGEMEEMSFRRWGGENSQKEEDLKILRSTREFSKTTLATGKRKLALYLSSCFIGTSNCSREQLGILFWLPPRNENVGEVMEKLNRWALCLFRLQDLFVKWLSFPSMKPSFCVWVL